MWQAGHRRCYSWVSSIDLRHIGRSVTYQITAIYYNIWCIYMYKLYMCCIYTGWCGKQDHQKSYSSQHWIDLNSGGQFVIIIYQIIGIYCSIWCICIYYKCVPYTRAHQTGTDTIYATVQYLQWASYQIRKIAGYACAGNAGNVFPRRWFQRKPLVSDPGMHHGTCVTHVSWCMSGSLTCGDGENVPGIPGACATRNFTYLVRGPLIGSVEVSLLRIT